MESFLNVLCLLIALGSFACWHQRVANARPGSRRRYRKLIELVALACALVVFLPSISITDDLHAELAVVEDSSASRRRAASVSEVHGPAHQHLVTSPPALLPQHLILIASGTRFEDVPAGEPLAYASVAGRIPSDRAPPSL